MAGERATELRLHEIAALAEAVAGEHAPAGRTEPERILRHNRITTSYGRYEDAFDGLLEHRGGRFHVYANLDRLRLVHSPRARFTLAHELGHFYIDEHRRALRSGLAPRHPSFTDHQSRNPVEIEADHFACHLLMPTERFIKAARKTSTGLQAVLDLKEVFGTSITSTAIRLTRLNIGACTLVKWDPDGFAWKWFSPAAYDAGYRRTIERVADVPRDSATGRALANEAAPPGGFFHAASLASAWFRGVQQGAPRDAILIEQAISLGEFGVLTMLFPERGLFETSRPDHS